MCKGFVLFWLSCGLPCKSAVGGGGAAREGDTRDTHTGTERDRKSYNRVVDSLAEACLWRKSGQPTATANWGRSLSVSLCCFKSNGKWHWRKGKRGCHLFLVVSSVTSTIAVRYDRNIKLLLILFFNGFNQWKRHTLTCAVLADVKSFFLFCLLCAWLWVLWWSIRIKLLCFFSMIEIERPPTLQYSRHRQTQQQCACLDNISSRRSTCTFCIIL